MNSINSGIYLIKCIKNNKIYVGSAINLKDRWRCHGKDLKNNKHHNRYLQGAYNKYGINAFQFEILEYVIDKNKLLEREQYYMDIKKSYNKSIGFNLEHRAGSSLGLKRSNDIKTKLSLIHKKRLENPIVRQKISEALYKRWGNPLLRQKMSNKMKGRFVSTETRNKHSLSMIGNNLGTKNKGRILTEKHKANISFAKRRFLEGEIEDIKQLLSFGVRVKRIAEIGSCCMQTIYRIKNDYDKQLSLN